MARSLLSLIVIVMVAVVAGCASAPPPPPHGRGASSPRVRCLANPNDTELRPLFFLFCVESP